LDMPQESPTSVNFFVTVKKRLKASPTGHLPDQRNEVAAMRRIQVVLDLALCDLIEILMSIHVFFDSTEASRI